MAFLPVRLCTDRCAWQSAEAGQPLLHGGRVVLLPPAARAALRMLRLAARAMRERRAAHTACAEAAEASGAQGAALGCGREPPLADLLANQAPPRPARRAARTRDLARAARRCPRVWPNTRTSESVAALLCRWSRRGCGAYLARGALPLPSSAVSSAPAHASPRLQTHLRCHRR